MESLLILLATLAILYVAACLVLNEDKGEDGGTGLLRMRRPAREGKAAGPAARPGAGARRAANGGAGVAAKAGARSRR